VTRFQTICPDFDLYSGDCDNSDNNNNNNDKKNKTNNEVFVCLVMQLEVHNTLPNHKTVSKCIEDKKFLSFGKQNGKTSSSNIIIIL
jgi:hypothetical protein